MIGKPGTPLRLGVIRDGREMLVTVTPKRVTYTDQKGVKKTIGQLGIGVAPPPKKVHGPFAAVWAAVKETWSLTITTVTAINQMIVGKREFRDLGGPLRIAEMSGDMAQNRALCLRMVYGGSFSVSVPHQSAPRAYARRWSFAVLRNRSDTR